MVNARLLHKQNDPRFVDRARRLSHRTHDLGKARPFRLALKCQAILDKPFGIVFGRHTHAFCLGDKLCQALSGERGKPESCVR